jgi:hypothetical protein
MDRSAWTAEFRGAVYSGDGRRIVALLERAPVRRDVLQFVGDGIVTALAQGVGGARGLADEYVAALRDRGWAGDHELAEQLAATSTSTPQALKALPVDLDELSTVLEGDPVQGNGRIDLWTGQVWPWVAVEYAREKGLEEEDESDDGDRWLVVWCEGSRDAYNDMVMWVDEIEDPRLAERLDRAMAGRGAFRRFKDVLGERPDELQRWFTFSEERRRGRARVWLADAGYMVGHRAAENLDKM